MYFYNGAKASVIGIGTRWDLVLLMELVVIAVMGYFVFPPLNGKLQRFLIVSISYFLDMMNASLLMVGVG